MPIRLIRLQRRLIRPLLVMRQPAVLVRLQRLRRVQLRLRQHLQLLRLVRMMLPVPLTHQVLLQHPLMLLLTI